MGCCRMMIRRERMLYRIKVKEGKKKKKKAMIFHGCADVDTARRGLCIPSSSSSSFDFFIFNTKVIHQVETHRSLLTDECCRVSAIYSFRWIVFPLYTILLRFFLFCLPLSFPLGCYCCQPAVLVGLSHLIRAVVMIVTVTCFLATDHHGRARLASKRK